LGDAQLVECLAARESNKARKKQNRRARREHEAWLDNQTPRILAELSREDGLAAALLQYRADLPWREVAFRALKRGETEPGAIELANNVVGENWSRSVADVGLFEFRRELEYKAPMQASRIVLAGWWYASTKTCFACETVSAKVVLGMDEWACDGCGMIHDRDGNAADNLSFVAGSSLAAASPPKGGSVTVCGAVSAGRGLATTVKLTAVKQKPTHGLFVHV
jgi:transposase